MTETFDELHRRFDGPVPKHLLEAAEEARLRAKGIDPELARARRDAEFWADELDRRERQVRAGTLGATVDLAYALGRLAEAQYRIAVVGTTP